MENVIPENLEADIEAACKRGDILGATEVAIRLYGREIFNFLVDRLRSTVDADDVFSLVCSDIFRGISSFRWDSKLRTWAYTIARHRMYRFRKKAARQRAAVPISEVESADESGLRQTARKLTSNWRRTSKKSAIQDFRRELDPADQDILIFRIDRRMSWKDVARSLQDPDAKPLEGAALKTEVNRIKARYERAEARLRKAALAHGLIPNEET